MNQHEYFTGYMNQDGFIPFNEEEYAKHYQNIIEQYDLTFLLKKKKKGTKSSKKSLEGQPIQLLQQNNYYHHHHYTHHQTIIQNNLNGIFMPLIEEKEFNNNTYDPGCGTMCLNFIERDSLGLNPNGII